jgi:anion-transporting  ArsA/GET3 family ATPase
LGIPLNGELKNIALPDEAFVVPQKKGALAAAILDQKAVFDMMVRRFAPDEDTFHKILANKLYQAISARLSGSLEYMALAQLQHLVDSGAYDMIVLDTPPDTQALDFLNRPNVLEQFMENKVMAWLIKPFHLASKLGIGRLMTFGEKLMGGIARVTGVQSLHLVAEFLVLMQQVVAGFHRAGSATQATLKHARTRFLLVTKVQRAALRAAASLNDELRSLGYTVDQVIFNRTLPPAVAEELRAADGKLTRESVTLAQLARRAAEEQSLADEFLVRLGGSSSVLTLGESEALENLGALLAFSEAFRT